MKEESIVAQMQQNEINELIIFSPSNLKDFFDDSIEVLEAGVPSFGQISKNVVFKATTNE